LWKRTSLSQTDNLASPMTLADLIAIRNFLVKVVVRGPEEEQLVNLVARIEQLLATHKAA
jgi:hypothetical protein